MNQLVVTKPFSFSVGTRENAAMEEIAPAAEVHVSLLGDFAITVAGEPVEDHWRLRKAKTLVKLLALAPRHRLHRAVVVERLWPDAEPEAAANNLHQIVHTIRRMMGATSIALNDDVVRLCPAGGLIVDVDVFEQAAAHARSSSDVPTLQHALQLWTGPLLPEDRYAEWALEHGERLTETHVALATLLGSKLSEQGDHEAALALVEPLASSRPLDEHLHRVLIEVLAGLGRRWEAIEAYERLRAALDEAYAAEPAPETRTLYRRLLTGGKPMPTTTPHNLPGSSTSFIGRRRLLSELSASLGRTRLLTLTGVGGVGKSRLALELGRLVGASTEFPDGVWLVELAGIQDTEVVASTVASAVRINLRSGRPPVTALAEQLGSRALLLIMDNCEHLLDACCELIDEVLAQCPNINIVTTSREPLALPGEMVYRVPSLELPSGTDVEVHELSRLEAVQLFVERAWLTAPSFKLNTRTAGPVAEICHRLDGMPLALELAAARLAHLTVNELADGLGDALTLLGQRRRGRLDRQQTLAAQLTTSCWRFWVSRGLISEGARWLTLALNAAPDRSALRARALAAMAVMNIRQANATELTAIGEEIVDLLSEYGEPSERAHGYHQRALLTFMAGDWDLAETQSEETLRVSTGFPTFASAQHFAGVLAMARGEIEAARGRFDAALQALERVPDDAAPFFIAMSVGWAVDDRRDPPLPFGEETVLFGRRVGAQQAAGYVRLAIALSERLASNIDAAFALIDDAYDRFHAVDDRYGEAYALSQHGHVLRWVGQYEEADAYLRRSESIRRDLRDQRALAISLEGRALNAAAAGAADQARTLGREAFAMMEESGDIAGFSVASVNLGVVEVFLADLPAALIWLDRALAVFPIPGGHRSLGWLHLLRAHVLRQLGDVDGSLSAATAAQNMFAQLGVRRGLIAVQRIC